VRHPIEVSRASALAAVRSDATIAAALHDANSNPIAAPAQVSTSASVASCRKTRRRLAPMASRIATSFLRAAERASKRLDTLAQAMPSSSTVNASSTRNGSANWLRTRENPVRPGSSPVRRARNIARRSGVIPGPVVPSMICGQTVCSIASALSRVTPASSRPIKCSHEEVVEPNADAVWRP
jgi:hypothetical protein